MSTQIDREGVFRAKITDSGVSTSKKGMPQFVADFQITEMWVTDSDSFEHFGITEPSWVDWSSYGMSTTGYLQLVYADKKQDGAITPLFYMEQLVEALGWDGLSFSGLGEKDWTGREVTIWVDENEYNGNISLRVQAIGKADASPSRGGVRALDAAELKGLDAQFASALLGAATKAAAVQAPAAKAPAKAPAKVAPKAETKAAAGPPKPAPKAVPKADTKATTRTLLVDSMSKDDAWAAVSTIEASDEAKADAWVSAAGEVIPDGDEDAATDEQWAKVAQRACAVLEIPFD